MSKAINIFSALAAGLILGFLPEAAEAAKDYETRKKGGIIYDEAALEDGGTITRRIHIDRELPQSELQAKFNRQGKEAICAGIYSRMMGRKDCEALPLQTVSDLYEVHNTVKRAYRWPGRGFDARFLQNLEVYLAISHRPFTGIMSGFPEDRRKRALKGIIENSGLAEVIAGYDEHEDFALLKSLSWKSETFEDALNKWKAVFGLSVKNDNEEAFNWIFKHLQGEDIFSYRADGGAYSGPFSWEELEGDLNKWRAGVLAKELSPDEKKAEIEEKAEILAEELSHLMIDAADNVRFGLFCGIASKMDRNNAAAMLDFELFEEYLELVIDNKINSNRWSEDFDDVYDLDSDWRKSLCGQKG